MKNTGHSPQSRSAVPRWYQILALVRDTRSEANSRAASAQAPSSPAERPIIPALVLPTNVVRPSLSASGATPPALPVAQAAPEVAPCASREVAREAVMALTAPPAAPCALAAAPTAAAAVAPAPAGAPERFTALYTPSHMLPSAPPVAAISIVAPPPDPAVTHSLPAEVPLSGALASGSAAAAPSASAKAPVALVAAPLQDAVALPALAVVHPGPAIAPAASAMVPRALVVHPPQAPQASAPVPRVVYISKEHLSQLASAFLKLCPSDNLRYDFAVARFLRVVGNGCCFSKTALGIAFAKEFEALAGEEDTGAMAAHRLFEVEKCGLWWEIEYRDGIVCAEHAAGLDGDDVVAHDHACYL